MAGEGGVAVRRAPLCARHWDRWARSGRAQMEMVIMRQCSEHSSRQGKALEERRRWKEGLSRLGERRAHRWAGRQTLAEQGEVAG